MDVRDKLLTENPWKLMISLSLPAILGQLIVGLYAFVDSIYVGQMVGTDAMSAVSAASPFVLINNAIAVLLGIGSGSVLSRAIGKKDKETVDKIIGNLTFLVIILSSVVMIIGIIFAPEFLRLSGAGGEVLEMGVSYLRTVYLGSIFVNFMQGARPHGGCNGNHGGRCYFEYYIRSYIHSAYAISGTASCCNRNCNFSNQSSFDHLNILLEKKSGGSFSWDKTCKRFIT